jgi:ERCC4-type nuclease
MIIKIDCREKDLYLKLNNGNGNGNGNGENTKNVKSAIKNKPVNDPKFHIMDLGDGMTINVPIPQNMNKSKSKPAAATESNTHNHTVISERMAIGDIAIMRPAAAPAPAPAAADNAQDGESLVVLLERKTIYDLAASIKDGRYKEQSFRLTNTAALHNHNIVYIIEGDLAKYDVKRGGMSVSAIQSAMVSLMYYKGFSVYRTMNLDETSIFIQNFADKLDTEDGKRTPYYGNTCTGTGAGVGATSDGDNLEKEEYCDVAVKKEKRDYITRENIGVIMLSQIPGVSSKIATAIMKKYNNSIFHLLADMKRKLNHYEDTISPDDESPNASPNAGHIASPISSPKAGIVRNNKLKYLSECFKDINVNDVKCTEGDPQQPKPSRKIGKAIVSKIYHYLCEIE